jgi:hypothetical protein
MIRLALLVPLAVLLAAAMAEPPQERTFWDVEEAAHEAALDEAESEAGPSAPEESAAEESEG